MNTREKLEHLLSSWFRSIDAPLLEMNEAGVCAFHHKDDKVVIVEIPSNSSVGFVYSTIADAPSEGKAAFYEKALTLNAHGIQTKGACLALDANSHVLYLYRTLRVEVLDDTTFSNLMTNFITAIGDVRTKLSQIHSLHHAQDASSGDGSKMHHKHILG